MTVHQVMSNEATMRVYDPNESDYEADEECAAAEVSLTIIPATYPELEREVYRSVDDQTTVTPEPCELTELERDPVEVEVDAMFDEVAITAADLREGLAFRLSQRGE